MTNDECVIKLYSLVYSCKWSLVLQEVSICDTLYYFLPYMPFSVDKAGTYCYVCKFTHVYVASCQTFIPDNIIFLYN